MVPSSNVKAYMVTYVKKYLRIDYSDDDTLIADIIQAGYYYLKDAIDHFEELYNGNEEFARKVELWIETQWCPPMYDDREGMFKNKDVSLGYAARAMLTQLQLYVYEESEESDDEDIED